MCQIMTCVIIFVTSINFIVVATYKGENDFSPAFLTWIRWQFVGHVNRCNYLKISDTVTDSRPIISHPI